MQILEASMFGLRTVRAVFRSGHSPVSVTLYPMVHVGEARFYEEAYANALSHDVVLFEGLRSSVGRNLTRSYRWINLAKLDLVLQPRLSPDEAASGRLVRADLTAEEFLIEWLQLAWYWRAAFAVLAPLFGVHRRLFATRESLAKGMTLDDLRSVDEVLRWSPDFDAFHRSIGDARDRRLLECLGSELDNAAGGETSVAIIYGARHMRAVIRELTRRGFRCVEARWLTVFKT